jgi:cobalt/nickel transport protein
MRPKDRNLVIIAVIICLGIAVLAPFIASNNPDGLEKSAQQISPTKESGAYKAPFADYSIPLLGNGQYSGIAAMLIGILIVLGLGYLGALILKRRKPPEHLK